MPSTRAPLAAPAGRAGGRAGTPPPGRQAVAVRAAAPEPGLLACLSRPAHTIHYNVMQCFNVQGVSTTHGTLPWRRPPPGAAARGRPRGQAAAAERQPGLPGAGADHGGLPLLQVTLLHLVCPAGEWAGQGAGSSGAPLPLLPSFSPSSRPVPSRGEPAPAALQAHVPQRWGRAELV